MRRPQGGRGRPLQLCGLFALLALVAVACGRPAASGVQPAASAHCTPVELPPVQGGAHLIGDQSPPVDYSSTPPTSGWHSSGSVPITVHGDDQPLSEPDQVSILEGGGVVVTYNGLDEQDRGRLANLVRSELAGRVAVTPYDRLEDGQVAMAAWGVLQRCDRLDLDAVRAFADAYADANPTTGH